MRQLLILLFTALFLYLCSSLNNSKLDIGNHIVDEHYLDSLNAVLSMDILQLYEMQWLEDSLDVFLLEHFFDKSVKSVVDSSSNILYYKSQIKDLDTGKIIVKEGEKSIEIKRRRRVFYTFKGTTPSSFVTSFHGADEIVDVECDNKIIINVLLKRRHEVIMDRFEILNLYFLINDDSKVKIFKNPLFY